MRTPGMWVASFVGNIGGENPIGVYEILADDRARVAEYVSESDARLIAAAPELLAALKAIVALDDGDKPDLWHFEAEFEAASAAIAKAEGA